MAKLTDPKIEKRVIVARPQSFQGHSGNYPKPGVITYVSPSKRSVEVVFEGELDELWFRVDELDELE